MGGRGETKQGVMISDDDDDDDDVRHDSNRRFNNNFRCHGGSSVVFGCFIHTDRSIVI